MGNFDHNQLQELVDIYQQLYFTHDLPVPFKDHLSIHPVKVVDYYDFYSLVDILKLEKNEDPTGVGIGMTHLDYLLYQTRTDNPLGESYTRKLIRLLELIFNIQNGIKCTCDDNGDTFVPYTELFAAINKEQQQCLKDQLDEVSANKRIFDKLYQLKICPKCQQIREDVIRFNVLANDKKDLIVDNVEITSQDFDLLRKIVLYQNIPDYSDEYVNPELKRQIELAAKLENPNNVTPTLEKQEMCIVASTGYTLEEVKQMSIRHLAMLLRTVDAKIHYQVYKTAATSGMVTFKGEIEHWIYSSDKPHSMLEKAMSLNSLKSKMAPATGG